MARLSAADAEARARAALGVAPAERAEALLVERLDRPDEAYYLVLFGPEPATSAVATVDASTGRVTSVARLSGGRPHLGVARERALQIAGIFDAPAVELVWRPCQASRSPLYPIWRVVGATATVFVDQQGKRWDQLSLGIA